VINVATANQDVQHLVSQLNEHAPGEFDFDDSTSTNNSFFSDDVSTVSGVSLLDEWAGTSPRGAARFKPVASPPMSPLLSMRKETQPKKLKSALKKTNPKTKTKTKTKKKTKSAESKTRRKSKSQSRPKERPRLAPLARPESPLAYDGGGVGGGDKQVDPVVNDLLSYLNSLDAPAGGGGGGGSGRAAPVYGGGSGTAATNPLSSAATAFARNDGGGDGGVGGGGENGPRMHPASNVLLSADIVNALARLN
jgi:hypothetical protein